MIITKNNTLYSVKETDSTWVLIRVLLDAPDLSYKISKKLCPTFGELEEFVNNNDLKRKKVYN